MPKYNINFCRIFVKIWIKWLKKGYKLQIDRTPRKDKYLKTFVPPPTNMLLKTGKRLIGEKSNERPHGKNILLISHNIEFILLLKTNFTM